MNVVKTEIDSTSTNFVIQVSIHGSLGNQAQFLAHVRRAK